MLLKPMLSKLQKLHSKLRLLLLPQKKRQLKKQLSRNHKKLSKPLSRQKKLPKRLRTMPLPRKQLLHTPNKKLKLPPQRKLMKF